VFSSSGGTFGTLVFLAIVVFSPLLYLAKIYPIDEKIDGYFLLAVSAMLVVYPTAIPSVNFDFRPYLLLAPFFALTAISIFLKRRIWESLLFFILLLSSREEALLLGAALVLSSAVMSNSSHRERSRFISLFTVWLIWAAASFIYFDWANYELRQPLFSANWKIFFFLFLIACLSLFFHLWKKDVVLGVKRQTLAPFAYATVFVPLAFGLLLKHKGYFDDSFINSLDAIAKSLILSPRYYLHVAAFSIFLLIFWCYIRNKAVRGVVLVAVLAVCVGSLATQVALLSEKYVRTFSSSSSEIVHDVRQITDKYKTVVLTDYSAHQAFFDYQNVFIYQRLPWYKVQGRERFYPSPETTSTLLELIRKSVEYVVISKTSVEDIEKLFLESGIEWPSVLAENDRFIVYRMNANAGRFH
jgi:hypothetical protein